MAATGGTGTKNTSVRFWRPPGIAGIEVMHAVDWQGPCVFYHERFDICTLLTADVEWRYRHRTYAGGPGRLMVMEPGELHVTTAVSGPGSFEVLMVDAECLAPVAEALGLPGPPHLDPGRAADSPLWSLFLRLHRSLASASATALDKQTAVAEGLVAMLARSAEGARRPWLAAGPRAVGQARDYLHDAYDQDVSLDDLATVAGISPYHLSREFRRHVGIGQHRYQMLVRVERARALLRSGTSPSEVATCTGFYDQSHLTRWFKRVWGATPAAYARDA